MNELNVLLSGLYATTWSPLIWVNSLGEIIQISHWDNRNRKLEIYTESEVARTSLFTGVYTKQIDRQRVRSRKSGRQADRQSGGYGLSYLE